MKINIVVHGPSVKTLEENIHLIDWQGTAWASLNKIAHTRKMLSAIDQDLAYAYFSDMQFVNEYAADCKPYLAAPGNKNIITSDPFIREAIRYGKIESFIPKQGVIMTSNYSIGKGIDGRYYNSFTAMILVLIALGFRHFNVFGLDGGPLEGQQLYCDTKEQSRDGMSNQDLKKALARDTIIMNEMFWKEVDRITKDHVTVINYSPNSHITCFEKQSIESLF